MWRTPQTAASVKPGHTAVPGRSSAPSVPSTLTPTRGPLHAPHVLLTSMLVSCLHYTIKPVQTEPPSNHANSSVYRSVRVFLDQKAIQFWQVLVCSGLKKKD